MRRHHQFHVWFNDELSAALTHLARQNDEPISATLRRIVQEYFRHRAIGDAARDKLLVVPTVKR